PVGQWRPDRAMLHRRRDRSTRWHRGNTAAANRHARREVRQGVSGDQERTPRPLTRETDVQTAPPANGLTFALSVCLSVCLSLSDVSARSWASSDSPPVQPLPHAPFAFTSSGAHLLNGQRTVLDQGDNGPLHVGWEALHRRQDGV